MNYYDLALPLNIDQLFTYKCESELERGCRVMVNFNNNLLTGFIWSKREPLLPDSNHRYRYKDIIEVIDEKPLLPADLISLAEWISHYYFCSLGTVIMAMLPTAIQIQIATDIRLSDSFLEKKNTPANLKKARDTTYENTIDLSAQEKQLLALLEGNQWRNVNVLRDRLKKIPLYKHLENLEEAGIIEVKRTFDSKIKKKFANFIIITDYREKFPELTAKQQEAWNRIKKLAGYKDGVADSEPGIDQLPSCKSSPSLNTASKNETANPVMTESEKDSPVPLARLANDFSYSVIKALRNKGLITVEPREIEEKPHNTGKVRVTTNFTLTEEQKNAFQIINEQVKEQTFNTFLIYGVTGSGKTEVYIRLIRECLSQERNALILVPEISLTPQMEERFFNAFGESIAILHSHRNDRERWEEWKRIKRKECRIVLGARSAVFAPLENIGIIIVDEEHEGSYKQDKNPRYNARDIAVLRGKQNEAVVVLGSATPSLESWHNVQSGKYTLLKLTHRPLQIPMPAVTILDMKDEEGDSLFSELLKEKILQRLDRQEQIILFQNRRGYASYVICINCGRTHRCSNCDVSLIYHSETHHLMCHYCGHREKMFRKCPDCGSYVLEFGVAGTQQLEKQLQILFPSAKLLRMDADTTSGKDSYNKMYKRMREGTVDILFGTQMIAKGLDFPNVTLVGVISADNSLNIPDFRSTERTFQLLTQVAGRSGRGDRTGEVIIQTYNPKHYAVVTAQNQDFNSFVEMEMAGRKALVYPPYVRTARLVFSHSDAVFLKNQLDSLKPYLKNLEHYYEKAGKTGTDKNKDVSHSVFAILGPVATPIHKINNKYRFHVILKTDSVNHLLNAVKYLTRNMKLNKSVKSDIDIDPSSLL